MLCHYTGQGAYTAILLPVLLRGYTATSHYTSCFSCSICLYVHSFAHRHLSPTLHEKNLEIFVSHACRLIVLSFGNNRILILRDKFIYILLE